jgi:formylglycine-generating enzyme required for sulfatase activity
VLPDIIKNLVNAAQQNRGQPKLAVLPFYTTLNGEEAERLAQLMSIAVANRGKYEVFPWALPVEAPALNVAIPYSGIIDLKAIRQATNARYVLTGDVLSLGTTNLFRAAIMNTGDGSFVGEGDMEYRIIAEDLGLLADLSSVLTNAKGEEILSPSGRKEGLTRTEVPVREGWTIPASASDILNNFVKIEAGTFIMGSPSSEVSRDRDEVQHQVVVGSFYIGKYEVTQEEYEAVMGSNPSHFRGTTLPVEQISWFDAVVYCNARSIREGLIPVYIIREEEIIWNHNANGYRLPTEAEWEYACRSGTTTVYNVGNTITPSQVNYDGNYPYNNNAKGLYRTMTTPV